MFCCPGETKPFLTRHGADIIVRSSIGDACLWGDDAMVKCWDETTLLNYKDQIKNDSTCYYYEVSNLMFCYPGDETLARCSADIIVCSSIGDACLWDDDAMVKWRDETTLLNYKYKIKNDSTCF